MKDTLLSSQMETVRPDFHKVARRLLRQRRAWLQDPGTFVVITVRSILLSVQATTKVLFFYLLLVTSLCLSYNPPDWTVGRVSLNCCFYFKLVEEYTVMKHCGMFIWLISACLFSIVPVCYGQNVDSQSIDSLIGVDPSDLKSTYRMAVLVDLHLPGRDISKKEAVIDTVNS